MKKIPKETTTTNMLVVVGCPIGQSSTRCRQHHSLCPCSSSQPHSLYGLAASRPQKLSLKLQWSGKMMINGRISRTDHIEEGRTENASNGRVIIFPWQSKVVPNILKIGIPIYMQYTCESRVAGCSKTSLHYTYLIWDVTSLITHYISRWHVLPASHAP